MFSFFKIIQRRNDCMKKGIVIFSVLAVFAFVLSACASTQSSGEVVGVTPEDFAAACEEVWYTYSDSSGAQAAPSLAGLEGIKIGKAVAVTTQASDCGNNCDICGCDKDGNNCKCQD